MTAPPQIITRALTFEFAASVNSSTGLPDIMEVAIIPLQDASNAQAGATFAGGLKTQDVELSAPLNSVVFNLIPSAAPGNSTQITYRVMWRAGVLGRTETYDFLMPDADLTWDQLRAGVGTIINGESYLQQTDLGVPGRVARLDDNGEVINASGIPAATDDDIVALQNSLVAETNAREAADSGLNANLLTQISVQTAATLNTANLNTANQITSVNADITTERSQRIAADTDLQNQITTNLSTQGNLITTNSDAITGIQTALTTKADLVNGFLSIDQVPTTLIPKAIPVADQASMLALTTSQVFPGNIAVRPDGIFFYGGGNPSSLSSWTALSVVSSVNNKRGAVTLAAADVNAIPVGGAISQSQVTGLSTTLLNKAAQSDMTTVQTQLAQVRNQTAIANLLSTGLLTDASMPTDIALVNTFGQVTTKGGTIVSTGGGGGGGTISSVNGKTTPIIVLTLSDISAAGGSITESQVTGLSTDLTNRVLTTDTRLSDARTPTAHATTHAAAGSDPITVSQTQVTGLNPILTNNALTTTSNAVNRISSLEGRVTAVEGGGGGSGGGTGTTAVFYDNPNTTTEVTDLSTVILHSPWGIDSDGSITGTTGTHYYLHTGVRPADAAYPYISPNGHLSLSLWNEAGAPDPVYALESDLTTLSTTVDTKADQTDLTALSTTVDMKANQSDLSALTITVGTKANQSDLNTTNSQVATKANQSDLTSLTTTVGTKANQTDMTTAQTNISALQTAMPSKADLVGGVLKASEIPTGIPQANISGLTTSLSAKADLVSGTVPTAQLPSIPQSQVTGLGTTLGAKADLVGGVVPMSQIPLGALPNVQTVANRAAMLALTTAQVQYGDLCLITSTTDQGTYVLTGNDPSNFANWTELSTGNVPVTSVNTKVGDVVLTASDVGALASNASIPQSQVTGLTTALSTFATTTAMNTALAGKTSFSDVQSMFTASSFVKRADYVATASITSLAGQQSVDGVLVPVGATVLTTAQPASVNNGLWVVSGSSWTRPADYATGSYLARDTIVVINNQTASANGTANNASMWQETAASGFIDTAGSTWSRIGWTASPFTPVAGNGISVSGSTFSANVFAGGGILAPAGGIQRDPAVIPAKFITTLPGGSTVVGVTHGLNNTTPNVTIWDTTSNQMVLAGVTSTSANAISIEFASAPATGQYKVQVVG